MNKIIRLFRFPFFTILLLIILSISAVGSVGAKGNERDPVPLLNTSAPSRLLFSQLASNIPTPKKPSGKIFDSTPKYVWTKVAGATNYQIQLREGATLVYNKYTSSSACGISTCYKTPGTTLGYYNAYKWRVRAKVSGVWRPWSAYKTFTVSQPIPEPKTPSGDISDRTPKYTWTKVSEATNYQIQLWEEGIVQYNKYASSSACGTSTCSKTPTSKLSEWLPYEWRVRAKIGGFWGYWSSFKAFTVWSPVPDQYTPSGDITDKTPKYTWSKIPGATKYQIQLIKGTTVVYNKYVKSTACGSSTCAKTPATVLGYYEYKWRIRTKIGGVWRRWSYFETFRVLKPGFNSTFNSNKNGWKTVHGSWSIYNASYLRTLGVEGKHASTYYNYDWTKLKYEVRMKRDGCTICANALWVRGNPLPTNTYNEWYDGYWFAYRNDGYFGVWKYNVGSATALKDWTYGYGAINQGGWNKLKVIADGSTLKFYINGFLVWEGSDATLTSGKVGIDMFREGTGNKLYVDWAKLTSNFTTSTNEEVEAGQAELEGGTPDMGLVPAP